MSHVKAIFFYLFIVFLKTRVLSHKWHDPTIERDPLITIVISRSVFKKYIKKNKNIDLLIAIPIYKITTIIYLFILIFNFI